jgi:hypothetical protein
VDPGQTAEMINRIADDYVMYAGWFKEGRGTGD